jgi:hypothetical protein
MRRVTLSPPLLSKCIPRALDELATHNLHAKCSEPIKVIGTDRRSQLCEGPIRFDKAVPVIEITWFCRPPKPVALSFVAGCAGRDEITQV